MEEIDKLCINTIRVLSAESVQKANSGHPGTPMALAPLSYVLWTKYLKHNPSNSHWKNRDRFVLSCGHASMLLYSMLHLSGYNLSLDDIKNFRQFKSKTPGHPEFGHTDGVETTTGPLGQGIANAVGFAIAQEMLATFNKPNFPIVDHHTYALVSDGDLMEGISHEACSLAGHLKLNKLIVFYDDNKITIDGSTSLAFSEDVKKRFEAYGWHVQLIQKGNEDIVGMSRAIETAQKNTVPSLIILKTIIGYGAPNKQNTAEAHGSALGEEEIRLLKKNLNWQHEEPFLIPLEVKQHFEKIKVHLMQEEKKWNELFGQYKKQYPELAAQFDQYFSRELPEEWEQSLPFFEAKETVATRSASGKVLNAIAAKIPNMVQGSADLHPSTNTYLKSSADFQAGKREGRNLHYGVREHAMGAIQNGIALYGAHIPLCSTFLIFSDYMRPAIRLACLMNIRSIFVFTHDSIGLGEDGPTHQPIEHFAALRAIPNNTVIRPADGNEVSSAWKIALERKGPTCILLTRQNVPTLERTKDPTFSNVAKGAYVLEDVNNPNLILIGTGSELRLCVEARKKLAEKKINARVVSMPSWELFEEQDQQYKDKILPKNIPKLAVEAGISQGWEKYADAMLGIEHFGASAPGKKLTEEFGFTVENVVKEAQELIERN